MTECNHDYGHCYECDSQQKLVYQSRCVKCVIRRLEFNLVENAELRTENEALRAKLPRWIPSAESRLKLRDGQLVVISVPGHGCYAATYRAWSGDLPCHYKENDDIGTIADPDDAGHWVYVIPTPPASPEQEPAS